LGVDEQMVVANPEITIVRVVEDIDFLLLATDGVWDRLSNQQAVDLVRSSLIDSQDLESVCQMLVDKCKRISRDVGSEALQDNMTAMLVILAK